MKKVLIASLVPLILLTGCSKGGFVLEDKLFLFDTMVNVKLYEGEEVDLKNVGNVLKYYDKICDNYDQRDVTNVWTLNQTNENTNVDEQLYKLLRASIYVHNEITSYFNPLCGSLAKAWKDALAEERALDQDTVNSEVRKISNSSLVLRSNNVVQRKGQAEIDLGGIAKGYALDKVADYLKVKDIKNYLIDAGSSSILLGEKQSGDGLFSVGINNLQYLNLKNCFVSTSGVSNQGVEIDGTMYSHIVNPITGSAINRYDEVIVISDIGYVGDALSTAFMMLSLEKIQEIETSQSVKTIVIKDDQIIYQHPDLEVLSH